MGRTFGGNDSMPTFRLAVLAGLSAVQPATAADLVPHRAVYDLSLASQSRDLVGVDGRIAIDMTASDCEAYDLDYRFVARFGEESEMTLTDQRILAREDRDGRSYDFEALSFVDGIEQSRVEGTARTREAQTHVEMRQPVSREFAIRAALFPLGHTRHLIERARAGDRIVETPLYDGDALGENLLSTTAIITPVPAGSAAAEEALAGVSAWRVNESYYNADSDADGLPTFHTRYVLYENGVSDDLFLDFGEYALRGGIAELSLGEAPSCP